MDAVRVVLNYKDYESLPNDGRRYEIHDGELSATLVPSPQHQRVIGRLFRALEAHVETQGLGEVFIAPIDVILSDTAIVQPDLVYLATDRLQLVSSRGIEGSPTLAVEVLSPFSVLIDRHTKFQLYARYEIPYYWIVDLESRALEAYVLSEGRYALAAKAAGEESLSPPPFGDLVLPLAPLWA